MDIEKFSRRMIELMPQCIRGFSRYEHNYLSRGEITIPQLRTLEYLSRIDGCLMNEIASHLGISRPAATGLVDRLIAQGLAAREYDDKDRRVIKIKISPKGKKIVANIWDQKRRSFAKVFSMISAQERTQYIQIMEKIANVLAQKIAEKENTKDNDEAK